MRSLLLLFLTLLLHHQSVIYLCGVETVTISPALTIRPSKNANNLSSIHLKNSKRSSSLDSDYEEAEDDDDDDDYYEEYSEDGTNSKSSGDNLQAKESHRVDVDNSKLKPLSLLAEDEDFCSDTYVDSAYFNGYDYILTRGDRLWYYYKDRHRLSKAYDQRRFTQGDHIQGAFNISRTPYYCLNRRTRSSHINVPSSAPAYATFEALRNNKNPKKKIPSSVPYNNNNNPNNNSISHKRQINEDGPNHSTSSSSAQADCVELQKLRSMAVYFLHNKERTRSYYNLDVRHPNGTQRRVRSRDLPWNMKQVGLLGGNLWPNGWEAYQQFRPVAFLPSRFEVIFILNHPRNPRFIRNSATAAPSPVLTWNNLDSNNWNNSWRSKVLQFDPPVLFTGMFEMNGVVYAIGEERPKMITPNANIKRVGQMFRYYIIDNNSRDLRKMNQTVLEFFGCIKPKTATSSVPTTTESSTMPTITSTERISLAPAYIKINPKINRLIPNTTVKAVEPIVTSSTPSTTTIMSKEEEKNEEFNEISEETKVDSKEKLLNNEETMSFKKSILLNQSKLNSDEQPIPKRPSDSSETSSPSVFLRNSRAKITSVTPNAANKGMYSGSFSSGTKLASPFATAGLRETDSIMLTILIAIVIGASILCIVLACLVINGKKRHLPPHFEGAHRIEPTIPKPSIIGLDYHRRKNSTSSSLTPFNFLTRYDSMNSLSAIYSHVHQRNRLSPMAEPCPSPNLHALHPPPPPPPPPPPAPLQESLVGSSRNIILHHHHHQHRTDSGGPILHNKAVSVNLTKYKSGHQSSSSLMNNSNSVPNLVSEVNKTSPQNLSPISSSNQLQIPQQQHFNRQINSNNRIKSFERFDNLI